MVREDEDVHIWVDRGSRKKKRENTKTGKRKGKDWQEI